MRNEPEILQKLHQQDPKAFSAFFAEYTYEMITHACDLLHDYVEASEIVTSIWYRLLKENFASVRIPFRQFLSGEVEKACQAV